LLIAPAAASLQNAHELVFVLDGELQRMPLAALSAHDGSYLVERYVISLAPSVAGFLSASTAAPTTPTSVVTVGNPSLDANRFPNLGSLPGAEQEARTVASLYPRSILLTKSDATETALRSALNDSEVVDIAAHALLNLQDPRNSRLLLADDARGDGVLTTADIAAMRLRTRVVVLAGCKTAVFGSGYGDVRNLAAAFLAAGAQSVVGSLWDIEDASARDLSIAFHRELRSGASPAEALRTAQLIMLRSPNAQPRGWAALQMYGFTR
jgi:CHAT domain-containing protein